VIKPLIKFNSLAIYIGAGFAAVGWNALAKGKSKCDLTKLVGNLDRNGTSLYLFFFKLTTPSFRNVSPTCRSKAVASLALLWEGHIPFKGSFARRERSSVCKGRPFRYCRARAGQEQGCLLNASGGPALWRASPWKWETRVAS